ncbi:uncharacterized protein A4U43_C03F10760 [Asparagus officinalis]|uniref:Uncharacterized protein n=1 Tax=Asparagus officinalis TaxID=4686 RepID=A0A5P1FDA1_ASPOF|nr:uncharacterized protein A4U43_C03F10760 [Asparagus officinalis]
MRKETRKEDGEGENEKRGRRIAGNWRIIEEERLSRFWWSLYKVDDGLGDRRGGRRKEDEGGENEKGEGEEDEEGEGDKEKDPWWKRIAAHLLLLLPTSGLSELSPLEFELSSSLRYRSPISPSTAITISSPSPRARVQPAPRAPPDPPC